MFKLPATRREFWETKIAGNKARDKRACNALANAGWRILTIWECSLKGPGRFSAETMAIQCERFMVGPHRDLEIAGNLMTGEPDKMTGAR
jgi:DNA mismatch endonuclease (patch repair protein)